MLDGRIGVHPPVRASTHDQVLREALAYILEVVQDESVSASSQLAATRSSSTIRVCLHFTVDDETTETVALEPRHDHLRLESVRRSGRRTRAAS